MTIVNPKILGPVLPNLTVEGDLDVNHINFDLTYSDGHQEGRLHWDADNNTLALDMPGGNVELQIGQENHIRVTNDEGSTINDGQAVYISGASGSNVLVKLATNATFAQSRAVGVATETFSNGQKGYVTTFGVVRGIDTSSFSAADYLYVGTSGNLTNTKPSWPTPIRKMGICIRSHATEGEIYVSPQSVPWQIPGIYIGDYSGGDYTEVEADGTIVNYGDATTYRDEYTALIGSKLESPSSHITQNTAEGSMTFDDTSTLSDYLVMVPQLNHDRLIGSDINIHIHWWQTSSNVPNWLVQYRWQQNGEAKVTSWTSVAYISNAFTYVSGTLNQISTFGTQSPGVDDGISSILQLRLLRDTNNDSGLFAGTDPLTGDVDAVSFDVHIECDMGGSHEWYVK